MHVTSKLIAFSRFPPYNNLSSLIISFQDTYTSYRMHGQIVNYALIYTAMQA